MEPLKDDIGVGNPPSQGEVSSVQPSLTSALTTPAPPGITPGLERTQLRQKMIEILASTANGCLQELGYFPGMQAKMHELEQRALQWQGENVKLYNDNNKLASMANQYKQTLQQSQQSEAEKAARIQRLLSENAALKAQITNMEELLVKKSGGSELLFQQKYNKLLKDYKDLSSTLAFTKHQLQQLTMGQLQTNQPHQLQQPPQNVQQLTSQQMQQMYQQPQARQPQGHPQQISHPNIPPHQSSAGPSTSLASHGVAPHAPQAQTSQNQQLQPGAGSRRSSGSMQAPVQQQQKQRQMAPPNNPYPNQQQQFNSQAQFQQYLHNAVPGQQSNPYPVPAQFSQQHNLYPIVPLQSAQRPHPQSTQQQPSQPPAQILGPWPSSSPSYSPNSSQLPQNLRINTSDAPARSQSTSRGPSASQSPIQTLNSAYITASSPRDANFNRFNGPNIPSQSSSLSQTSSPVAFTRPTPPTSSTSAMTNTHAMKRNSLAISGMPNPAIDDPNKRQRVEGPQQPRNVSGLPSPITPSVHLTPTTSSPIPSAPIKPSPSQTQSQPQTAQLQPENSVQSQYPNQSQPPVHQQPSVQQQHTVPPQPLIKAKSPNQSQPPVQQPPTVPHPPPVQSQSPSQRQPPIQTTQHPVQSQSPIQSEVIIPQPVQQQTSQQEQPRIQPNAAINPDALSQNPKLLREEDEKGLAEEEEEEEEEEEIIEVGPDGFRLPSDCLDMIYGKDRSGEFICKFCVNRFAQNLLTEPPVLLQSPSDEVLVAHVIAEHVNAWNTARAVD